MKKENPNAFKHWINAEVAEKYFRPLQVPPHEIQKINKDLKALELRGRVQRIAKELKTYLPREFPSALNELLKISTAQNLKSFELWPATEFIQMYGLDHPQESLTAMYTLTQKFTAEFSVRPFIEKFGEEIYKKLRVWHKDPNEHVRRWISEGSRPRLPWGMKLHSAVKDPRSGLALLEHLKFDHSLYVRKSVGNHLNDISKDHPALVVQTLRAWQKQVPADFENEFRFLSRLALRTLVKNGDPGALKYLGISQASTALRVSLFELGKKKLKVGDALPFQFTLKNGGPKKEKFILDYVLYFKKANGDLSRKVFKLKTGTLGCKETLKISRAHSFKPITTRKYYSGEHKIALHLNGRELKPHSFALRA